MTEALAIAIYGALLSTALGCITIYNFIRERRILRVEKHFSFSADPEIGNYDFVISNISSRPFTIIDCMMNALSKTENNKVEMAWGLGPKKMSSLYDDDEGPLNVPMLIHPGEVLIVRITSDEIIQQIRRDNRIDFGIKWMKTDNMLLEITHSMSKHAHQTKFRLEMDELKRAGEQPEDGTKRRKVLSAAAE